MKKWISCILWLLSILLFFVGLDLAPSNYHLMPGDPWGKLFAASVFLGIGFFLAMIVFMIFEKNEKNTQKGKIKKPVRAMKSEFPKRFLTIFLGLTILFSAYLYVRAENIEKELRNKNFKSNLKPTPTASQPTPTLKPIAKKDIVPIINPKDEEPWGIAKQIDEVTWSMKVGQDERIGTPQEIYESLNVYRQRHGKGMLAWDQNLAVFAQQRANYFNSIKDLDKHAGFKNYTDNVENLKKLGFWSVGENCNYGQRLIGVHLIEWIYAGDKPHDDNQLNNLWTHVGVGVEGLGVAIIFGANKI